jgi:uncharacterized protein YbbK (DUF523 family)/GNAT superfamily N-acetyltransferase
MELVSACLVGVACRYDGACRTEDALAARLSRGDLLPVCPELLGGLPLPRPPSEIRGGAGAEVLDGAARVCSREGADLTADFVRGAEAVLALAKSVGAKEAFLAARSPSCGVGEIYDGSFTGKAIPGDGVAAALLARSGIRLTRVERPGPRGSRTADGPSLVAAFSPALAPLIRPARPGDAAALARLSGQLGYPCGAEELAPRLERQLANGERAVIVAELEGEVAGWASLELVDRLYVERYAEITAFIVDEKLRGRGVGRLVMDEALRWAAAQNASLAKLSSNTVRKDAHRFYEARGFARTKESYTFEKRIG